jgi:hypothetical protein
MSSFRRRARRGRRSSGSFGFHSIELLETRPPAQRGRSSSAVRPSPFPTEDLPRNLTPAEIEYLKTHQLNDNVRAPSAPPHRTDRPRRRVRAMEGLVISWMTYTSILGQISKRVTDVGGRMYIGVTSSSFKAAPSARSPAWA